MSYFYSNLFLRTINVKLQKPRWAHRWIWPGICQPTIAYDLFLGSRSTAGVEFQLLSSSERLFRKEALASNGGVSAATQPVMPLMMVKDE